jgi:hypothetical protein
VGLLRGLFWFVLFLFFTFCFLVLFEYGPSDFTSGFKKEGQRIEQYVQKKISPPKKVTNPNG